MLDNFSEHSGYQKTEIGLLPVDWIIVPIGKVVTLSQYGLSIASEEQGKTPIVGMKDLSSGKVKLNNLAKVSIEQEDIKKFCLQPGDILLNRTNSYELVGKASIYTSDALAVFASYLVRFQFDITQALPEFINYFLNFYPAQKRLKRIVTKGVSQANINPTVFRNQFIIPLPPIEEQKKISEILATWDEAIATTEKLIAAKQKRKEAISESTITNYSKLECPGWSVKRLRDCLISEPEYGANASSIDFDPTLPRYVRITDIKENGTLITQGLKSIARKNAIGYLLEQGDFIFARSGATVGKTYLHRLNSGEFAYAGYLIRFRLNRSQILPEFLFQFTQTKLYKSWVKLTLRAGAQPNINAHEYGQLKVLCPPVEEQKRITDFLEVIDCEIELTKKQLDLLQLQKRGIMQKLLTGEWRVTVKPEA